MAESRIEWTSVAEQTASLLPLGRLDPAVTRWADQAARSSTPWHVALSGGADSVAALLLLWAHWPTRRRRLRALHFNHRLRGAASTADATFCRNLCAAIGVRLVVGTWQRPRGAAKPSEAEARAARMAFFEKHARALWLGHNLDDVAETMLMRLARGSGTAGLAAPRPVQLLPGGRAHLRPLLGIRKSEIKQVLRRAGAAWREDATNAAGGYFRNRVRHKVVPAWIVAAERDAVAGAGRSRLLLDEDDAALERFADEVGAFGKSGNLLLSRVKGQPRALVRRVLRRWIEARRPKVDISRQAFDALLEAVERGRPTRRSLGTDGFAVVRKGQLTFKIRKRETKFQRSVN